MNSPSRKALVRTNRCIGSRSHGWFLSLLSLCLASHLVQPARTAAQVGMPADPICRLRALPDGVTISGKLEYDVKAALLYRCLELVQWPSQTFPSAKTSLRIGILGKNQFGESLGWLSNKTIDGHKIVVKNVSRLSPKSSFQLVFVSASELQKAAEVLNNLGAQPVLTIGETPGFTEQGGMINLLLTGKNIRLEVNQTAAEKVGIALDPKLKQLADALAAPPPPQTSSPAAAPQS